MLRDAVSRKVIKFLGELNGHFMGLKYDFVDNLSAMNSSSGIRRRRKNKNPKPPCIIQIFLKLFSRRHPLGACASLCFGVCVRFHASKYERHHSEECVRYHELHGVLCV